MIQSSDIPHRLEHRFAPSHALPLPSFLIFVKGQGSIRDVWQEQAGGGYKSYVLVDGVPILEWQAPDCPTCARLLQAGDGRFSTQSHLERLHGASLAELHSNESWYEVLLPVLGLLEEGLYWVGLNQYCPTDGQGSLFWGSYEDAQIARAVNPGGWWPDRDCEPHFLVASQGAEKFSEERFAAARERFRDHPGIAYHLGGFLSLVLDGHHRALSAALEGELFQCMTIARVSWSWGPHTPRQGIPDEILCIFGQRVSSSSLSEPAREWLLEHALQPFKQDHRSFRVEPSSVRATAFGTFAEEASGHLGSYPTVEEWDVALRTGLPAPESVEVAFRGGDESSSPGDVLTSVIARRDPRARAIALRVCREASLIAAWSTALTFLRRFADREILDLFLEMAVHDCFDRDDLRPIVDEYLEAHADHYR